MSGRQQSDSDEGFVPVKGRRRPRPSSRGQHNARSSTDSQYSSQTNSSRQSDEPSRYAPSSSTAPATTRQRTSSHGSPPPAARSSLQPSSSKALVAVKRPGFGKQGEKIRLLANHFAVKAADRGLSQYEIKINPEVNSRAISRTLLNKLIEKFSKSHLRGHVLAYDGRGIAYANGSLPFEAKEFAIVLSEEDSRERTFKISIKFVKSLDHYALARFLSKEQTEYPQDIITALDIVLRETPSNKYVTISRSFFSQTFGSSDMSEGLISWSGYFQSLRPTQTGLSLNVDVSATAFYKPISVLEFIREFYNERSTPTSLNEKERKEIQKALTGVRVETTHLQNVHRRYRVTGITSQSAKQLTFTLDETEGTKISVAEYFRTHRSLYLQFDSLPCIKAGSDTNPKYLPLEVCHIVGGQRYVKKLNERQVSQILKTACLRPADRKYGIAKTVKDNNHESRDFTYKFGIGIQDNLTQVNARVLQPPILKYGDEGHERYGEPFDGKWTMKNKLVYRGGTVNDWALINFSRDTSRKTVESIGSSLANACYQIGMNFKKDPIFIRSSDPSNIEKSLYESVREYAKKLQLLIVVLPDGRGLYGRIKRVCDTELGVVTQCCQFKHLRNPKYQYLENVALKINVKVGGINTVLDESIQKQIPIVFSEPTIIFGADVTHPGPGDDSSSSIAAVVASTNWPDLTKYRTLLSAQPHRQEIIEDLYQRIDENKHRGMIRELLQAFYSETNKKPRRIIFYRDGVSEGQFYTVLALEIDAIRKACLSFEANYLPPITFIVVQKRHHTRLFFDRQSGNITPGTVVDTTICHPTEFDFYLCSHAGIQGTSRPAHYHVLLDENGFTADQLQSLTNNLCYTYARCTRAVSVVPPAYYAHLAAFRARHYIDTGSEYASSQFTGKTHQRTATTSAAPTSTAARSALPAVHEKVQREMFYC